MKHLLIDDIVSTNSLSSSIICDIYKKNFDVEFIGL